MGIIYVLWNITEEDEEKPNRKKESPEMDLFIPTHEWKEVKPGQAIPPVKRWLVAYSWVGIIRSIWFWNGEELC